MAVIKERSTVDVQKAGKQFEKLLNYASGEGWRHVRKETTSVQLNPINPTYPINAKY